MMHTLILPARRYAWSVTLGLLISGVLPMLSAYAAESPAKQRSVFYPPELLARAWSNA